MSTICIRFLEQDINGITVIFSSRVVHPVCEWLLKHSAMFIDNYHSQHAMSSFVATFIGAVHQKECIAWHILNWNYTR
jgi:hypothetical protein